MVSGKLWDVNKRGGACSVCSGQQTSCKQQKGKKNSELRGQQPVPARQTPCPLSVSKCPLGLPGATRGPSLCCRQESSGPRINSPGRTQPWQPPSPPTSPTDETAPSTPPAPSEPYGGTPDARVALLWLRSAPALSGHWQGRVQRHSEP